MPLILASNSASGGYNVANSLRFNSASSDYLSRTPASATNQKTFTISAWVKLSSLTDGAIFNAYISGTQVTTFFFYGNQLYFYHYDGSFLINMVSTQLFRDTSAWYHVMASIDTTQATSSNRVKLYVNGSQITNFSTSTYGSQNQDTFINSTVSHTIGRESPSQSYIGGYVSEFNFIDGQQLTPSSFGETNTLSGIWIPKAYTGSYGTNGFFLKFQDSSALGDDTSGNGNDFTVNNLTSVDQSTDTPTNNFATWNSLIKTPSTFSNGNLSLASASGLGAYPGSMATIVPTKGKWYAEIKVTKDANLQIGFITAQTLIDGNRSLYAQSSNIYWQDNNTAIAYYLNAVYQGNATVTGGTNSVSTYTTNDIIMLAMDLDNGYGWFGKNGTFQNSGNPASGTNAFNLASDYANGTTIFTGALDANVAANFGSPSYAANSYADAAGFGNFSYAVPSGYFALCTKNLADYG